MAKKGVCLARCTGELHPGPSGWMHIDPEALDFLLFRRAEQQKGIPSPLWRPLPTDVPLPLPTGVPSRIPHPNKISLFLPIHTFPLYAYTIYEQRFKVSN